jgi:hypothetical protein
MPRRKSAGKRSHHDEIIWYGIRTESWKWHYHLRPALPKLEPERFRGYAHIEIFGEPFRPTKLKAKRAELIIYGHEQDGDSDTIGLLTLIEETLQAVVWMPVEAMSSVLQMLIANELHYAVLRGERLRYRRGLIRDLDLSRAIDEYEDVPDI